MIKNKIKWKNDNSCSIDDVEFQVEFGEKLYSGTSRDQNSFIIGKARNMLEALLEIPFDRPTTRICDIGIYKGGSVAFYHKLFDPKKIIAIELSPDPVPALESYIKSNALEENIKTYYNTDQSDRSKIESILARELGQEQFDLIVDDASHFLKQTRESFNILFPHLAPGGYYIIEDWGWAHWEGAQWQDNGGPWEGDPPLTNLIFELTMLLASRPDLVASIQLFPAYAIIKKGYGRQMDRNEIFNISEAYLNRGKKVTLLT